VYLDLARDYQLDALPTDEHGVLLFRGGTPEEQHGYAVWLAEYLREARFSVSIRQQDLCARLRSAVDRHAAARALGMNAAWHEDDVFDVEAIVEMVVDEAVTQPEAQVALVLAELEARERPQEDDPDGGWEAELTVADIRLILAERADRRAHYGECGDALEECFPDLGWRVPLATIVQGEADPEQRVALVQTFYDAFRKAYSR
jgi:hypothetical protein